MNVSGALTSIAMQAAEALGLPLERVRIAVGDTASVGYCDVSAGSRTTFGTGLAAIDAARDLIERLRERAAALWGVAADQVSYRAGVLSTRRGRARRISLAELREAAGPLSTTADVDADQRGYGGTYGAHIVDVEVDPETGRVTILGYTAVQDVGRAVHPGDMGVIQGCPRS